MTRCRAQPGFTREIPGLLIDFWYVGLDVELRIGENARLWTADAIVALRVSLFFRIPAAGQVAQAPRTPCMSSDRVGTIGQDQASKNQARIT